MEVFGACGRAVREEEKQGGGVRTSWLGREQLPPSSTAAPFIHQCWDRNLCRKKNTLVSFLGIALVYSNFHCPLLGSSSEEIQITHRFFSSAFGKVGFVWK